MEKNEREIPDPERFEVSPSVLWIDRLMTRVIQLGGILVVAAVLLILAFIAGEVVPLFGKPRIRPVLTATLPSDHQVAAMGMDDHAELPFFASTSLDVLFLDTVETGTAGNRGAFYVSPGLPADFDTTVVDYYRRTGDLVAGSADGRLALVRVTYRTDFPDGRTRRTDASLEPVGLFDIGIPGLPVELLGYGDGTRKRLAAVIQSVDGMPRLFALRIEQERTLLGEGKLVGGEQVDLTDLLDGTPQKVLIPWEADAILVATAEGEVIYLFDDPDGGFGLRQRFSPFSDLPNPRIASIDFILADVSMVVTSETGETRTFSLYRDPEQGIRIWDHFRSFSPLDGGARFVSQSMRNRAFLIGRERFAAIRYNTTGRTRAEFDLPFTARRAILGPRYNGMLFLDTENTVHWWELEDPHPRASWSTYFGRLRYEGQEDAGYVWQSSGATDDFESKLSMVPLIIGTLKGTLYAMLFSLPIALLAAIYTSQFLKPELKRVVKPIMEIMASLPSVVLGFIAALWLAPLVSNAVPSVVSAVACMVAAAFAAGTLHERLPQVVRRRIPEGWEFLVFTPFMLLSAWLGWHLGAWVERFAFVVLDPTTGLRVADFRLWFTNVYGGEFEQRNSLVVGIVMGFAVIPLIFTITEDSLSNVPESFRSGSLALGASRWQTAIRVVVPTAAAGIFSAVMIGLGRAVGETMIVVMATGNVPVTDFNIFTGMRTLSANIAVELPEAPWRSTLYRSLFLGSLLLFLFTFVVNTVAEIMRQGLRERFKAVE